MVIREVMTTGVETIGPQATIQEAANRMKKLEIGILPVSEDGRAIGVVTDRDIAVRCCADGKDPRSTPVRDVMTTKVIDCLETQDVGEASKTMEKHKIRRLVVTDAEKKISGLLSVDDLAKRMHDPTVFSRVLREVAVAKKPSGAGKGAARRQPAGGR